MSNKRGEKRKYINISSSSSEYENEPLSDSDQPTQLEDEQISSSSSSCFDDDDEEEEEEEEEEEREGSCDRVVRRLQDKSDLHDLKLRDCHSYLRQHGLRITGTKTECIERIMTHWRIKDGNAEALYPRSSFVLDCTGDVCRGDVVLFKQKVKKFNKKRSKQFPCIRTVAGKVVRESYGAGKQQHTFTIEVLWSKSCKGVEQLPPLSCLLVKGRKLYRMRTSRQLWNNESERREVLAEKHERGDTARLVRAMNRGMNKDTETKKRSDTARLVRAMNRRTNKEFSKNKVIKRRKQALHAAPSTSGKRADAQSGKRGRTKTEKIKSSKFHQKAPRENLKQSKAKAPESSTKHQNSTNPYKKQHLTAQSFPHPSQSFHQTQMQPNLPFYPHRPLHNYDPNLQFSRFPPQSFHLPQLHPSFHQPHLHPSFHQPHYSHNYQDINAQSYPYPQHNFHPTRTHHDIRDIQARSHHPQSFQQSQMQYHHQPWNNTDAVVSPRYMGPPVIQVSQQRRFEPYLRS